MPSFEASNRNVLKEVNVARPEESGVHAGVDSILELNAGDCLHVVEDERQDAIVVREPVAAPTSNLKDRVEKYVRENRNHLTIDKLTRNQPITPSELEALEQILFTEDVAGSQEQLQQEYGEMPLGKFVRSILGLDVQAAQAAFADFIQLGSFTADQMRFIDTIITYLTKNGTIDKEMLFEPPPTHYASWASSRRMQRCAIIRIIDRINANAEVA